METALPPALFHALNAVGQGLALEAMVDIGRSCQFPIVRLPFWPRASIGGRKPRELGEAEDPGEGVPNPCDYAGRCPSHFDEAGILGEASFRKLGMGQGSVNCELVSPGVSGRLCQRISLEAF